MADGGVGEATEQRPTGELAAAVSNRLVQLVRDYTGRGPTKARTYIHDDVVMCVLQDTLTRGERVMADRGDPLAVIEHRRAFQRLMRDDAVQAVEEVMGKRVVAFLSDHHLDPDVAVETFLLEGALS